MSSYVCSNCGSPAAIDSRMGSVNHYLMCECVSDRYRIPGSYGGSRSDTYDDNVFHAHPIPAEEFRRR